MLFKTLFQKKITLVLVVVIVAVLSWLVFSREKEQEVPKIEEPKELWTVEQIGKSVEGRKIEAYHFGEGDKNLLFVGGVHGGYEWNSVVLAYEFIDYFKENPEIIPEGLEISIIPSLNPDGVYKIVGKEGKFSSVDVPDIEDQSPGRFNANEVDLNRNFDCKWQPESTWRNQTVSAGTKAFSEPEALALKNFVLKNNPEAVIFWHSQANAVYASECEDGILPETLDIMNLYAKSAGYQSVDSFDVYPVSGDAEGWLASIKIPAITVELGTHESIEWSKNVAGVKSLLQYYE